MTEALLDLLDPGLKGCHVLLQGRKVTFESLTPAAFIGHAGLDPPQGLEDGLVLLSRVADR
jgi:hypothetical protein